MVAILFTCHIDSNSSNSIICHLPFAICHVELALQVFWFTRYNLCQSSLYFYLIIQNCLKGGNGTSNVSAVNISCGGRRCISASGNARLFWSLNTGLYFTLTGSQLSWSLFEYDAISLYLINKLSLGKNWKLLSISPFISVNNNHEHYLFCVEYISSI